MAKHIVVLSIWPDREIEVDENDFIDMTRQGLIVSEVTASGSNKKPEATAKGTDKEKE